MGTRETYHRTIITACEIAGGEARLAERLGVPVEAVVNWLLRKRLIPDAVFLRAVDLIAESQIRDHEERRLFLAEVRRRNELR